jgi:hypothetical protein
LAFYLFSAKALPWAIYMSVSSYTLYSFSLNIMRQGVAVSLALIAAYFFYSKKYTSTLIFSLLAASFHSSALIVLVVFFILHFLKEKEFSYSFWLIGILVYTIFLLFPAVDTFTYIFDFLGKDNNIAKTYFRHLNYFSVGDEGPWLRFSSFVVIIISFSYINIKSLAAERVRSNNLDFLLKYYFVGFVLLSPLAYAHLMYYRLAWYFFAVEPLIIALIFQRLVLPRLNDSKSKMFCLISLFFFVFLYFFKTYFYTGGIITAQEYKNALL